MTGSWLSFAVALGVFTVGIAFAIAATAIGVCLSRTNEEPRQ